MSVFVAIEGPDGVGKSTLAANLAAAYKQRGNFIRFPRRDGPFAAAIYGHLVPDPDDCECTGALDPTAFALLNAADRRDSMSHEWNIAETKDVLVTDRYMFSGIAYAIAAGVDSSFAVQIERCQYKPDLVIYLELPLDEAQRRIAKRNERTGSDSAPLAIEAEAHQKRVVHGFEAAFAAYPDVRVMRMDALLPEDALTTAALLAIDCANTEKYEINTPGD